MAKIDFSGHGSTVEEAFEAALQAAMKDWKMRGPDDMISVHLESIDALYGGIVGSAGTRVVRVSRENVVAVAMAKGSGARPLMPGLAAGSSKLVLKLDVLPDVIYANLMPPVRRPQPHNIGLVLSVANVGDADYVGQSQDGALARFAVLRGRTEIWKFPDIATDVITPITIGAGQTISFTATWSMEDAVSYAAADLRAVGRFVPSGDSVLHDIDVRSAF